MRLTNKGASLVAPFLLAAICTYGCNNDTQTPTPPPWDWNLPDTVPPPKVPENNPMSAAKVELGRHLFYDKKLSGTGTFSCSSCHLQHLAFTDNVVRPHGATGEIHPRNSMSLTNVAFAPTMNWANPVVKTLEDQTLTPMFGETPVELGITGKEDIVLQRFKDDPKYVEMFRDAFPTSTHPITTENISKALATFERTLLSFNSPYDRYIAGDESALSESAKNGFELFFSERLECFHCHGGFNFTQSSDHQGTIFDATSFQNNGLYNLNPQGAYPSDNTGLFEFTGNPLDMGKFKPPTLRNIELTAPYMHDGSISTLEEVLDHYARGGRKIDAGPYAGDGSKNPQKNGFVSGFVITEQEKKDLIAFLKSLTDHSFITNPKFKNPFEPTP